jgi:hypothetical protein
VPKRTYVGSHAEVVLPDGTIAKRGQSVEIPEEIDIKELEASGNWESSSSSAKPAHGEKE